ncbi:EF-P 5-aminopentanol modification-associated protein YfmH [Periweissella beninensis]|uniref:Insulinase family protein n=1 Tax=Periweissella beninensis TaxID=504936 RepID=A0ABT0VJY4_9LACO|nr:pitrilysin family protein [Periweissella beninensis]MBM7544004.1 putative Zn-dependent peptidase [Periweissella beninensis]MCM2437438.1 insulinase family protein [Periweissella beninensis]MCT4396513.1 insulinase family protein [Periweissella beninensis]
MEKIEYKKLEEVRYQETLSNGLDINLLPKNDFHKTYAVLTVDYGATDLTFKQNGKLKTLPAGLAHFLEHKLFEKADYDAFELFGKYGASANAYTSYTKTSYLFSTTSNFDENLEILLDFVQKPFFDKKSVIKEQGIIGQEIKMYQDEPHWQLYTELLGTMYPKQPLAQDIAGTIDSITKISAELLYESYNYFYRPNNMNLFIVGKFDPTDVITKIKNNQSNKVFENAKIVHQPMQPTNVEKPHKLSLDVERPKVAFGIKGMDQRPQGVEGLKYSLAISMALDLIFGDTEPRYLRLYNEGIIDDSFSFDFELQRNYHFATITVETDEPQSFINEIQVVLNNANLALLASESSFELIKRETIGATIGMLNSLEGIANQYDGDLFDGATLLDELAILENISFDDIKRYFNNFIRVAQITYVCAENQ